MSPVAKFTLLALLRVGLIAIAVGGLVALVIDVTWGVALGALVILAVVGYYAYKLASLSEWLNDPQAATLPEGIGLWGDTLGHLYRVIRHERAAQRTLADSLSRFQAAATALPDGAVMLDQQYNIVWCNPSAEEHLGLSLKRDRMQVVTYLIRNPELIAYLNSRNFLEPLIIRLQHNKSGPTAGSSEVTLSLQLVAFGDDQMLLLSRDISERERLETIRRDFVANVSHELRTPLTVVTGFLETVTIAGTSNESLLKKSLAHMSAQTARMQHLVEDLLTLSRLEDNRNRVNVAPINIPELIASLVHDAEQLSAGRHTITKEITGSWLLGNRDEISSAFGNLITNAVRYTPDGGAISVQWTQANQNAPLIFRVIDNGEGIGAEHLPRLTERFYRVDRGRSRASGGTGLGLAIVKHVLLRHDSHLDIKSSMDALNHGTTFSAIFPPERACAAEPKPQAVAA
jgi:two-component system, OmpR family, phosphate regulon sensor histidine kinase PhoR